MYTGPQIITDGLVLYLDAANPKSYPGSGTAWSDLSSYGNNSTLTNGPTFNSGNKGSIVLDGSNDYINLPSQNSSANPLTGWGNMTGASNNSYTISIWVKTQEQGGSSIVTGFPLIARNNNDIYANLVLYNGLVYFIHYNGSWQYNIVSTTLINNNVWHNVTYVNKSNNTGDLYIDGVREVENESSSISGGRYFSPNNLGLGYNNNYLEGSFAMFKAYDRSLSPEEVKQNYNATKQRFK